MLKAMIIGAASMLTVTVAQATVGYDSSPTNPNGNATSFAYRANQIYEFGGQVGLAGTDRKARTASIRLRTGGAAEPATPGNVNFTLNFYSDLGVTSFASKAITFATPAGTADVPRPFFNVDFNLTDLNLVLPDTFYWGLSLDDPFADVTTSSINLAL